MLQCGWLLAPTQLHLCFPDIMGKTMDNCNLAQAFDHASCFPEVPEKQVTCTLINKVKETWFLDFLSQTLWPKYNYYSQFK